MKLTIALLIGAAAVAAATGQVDCSDPANDAGVCDGVEQSLLDAGKTAAEAANAVQILESDEGATRMNFATPGIVDYIFTFKSEGGDFIFCFGMCVVGQLADTAAWDVITDMSSTEADLEVARLAFAKDCVVNDGVKGFKILDERDGKNTQGDKVTVTGVPSPVSVVFWLLPNVANNAAVDPIDTFQADADAIYASSQDNSVRRPLFSVNAANQEGFDYLILFEGDFAAANPPSDSVSLFLWEDKDRSSGQDQNDNNAKSDSDFGDLVFAVNAILTPTVDPNADYFCDPANEGGANAAVCTTGVTKSSDGTSVTISWGPGGSRRC